MNVQHIIITCLLLLFENVFAQTNQTKHLVLPFLDKESQSNVNIVIWGEEPCPTEYTNSISNTNLFTPEEKGLIKEAFIKYKNVTTNSGPPSTVLAGLYKTNIVTKAMNRSFNLESLVADFQYTNFDAHEQIRLGGGMLLAEFRNKSNDGYNVSFTRMGGGTTLLSFGEIKNGLPNGLFVRFADIHEQGPIWDYRHANFDGSHLEEYRHYTNGMVLGKFLMWNPRNNNLILEADFKEPYDFERHRIDLRMHN